MKKCFFALAFASAGLCHAQAPATISGQLVGCADSTTVEVFEANPAGSINYFFKVAPTDALVRGERFSYQFRTAATGFASVTSKCLPRMTVFVEPGAAVTFTSQPGPDNKSELSFGGTNAAANNLLATNQLLNNGPVDGKRIAGLLATASTAPAMMRTLEAQLTKPLALLEAAYARHEISRTCRDFLKLETEQRLTLWVGSALVGHFIDSTRANLHLTMSRAETKRLATLFYARFDPYLPQYRAVAHFTGTQKAELVSKHILPGAAPTTRFWGQYQPELAPIASGLELYDYLPASQQQDDMGSILLTILALNALSSNDFSVVFAGYASKFPNSPFNPVIASFLREESIRTRAAAAQAIPPAPLPTGAPAPNRIFGFFGSGSKALAFNNVPSFDTVQTLGGLVRSQRPGRAVFVDLWASWCGPCIAEFKHEPALSKFMADNEVDILYIALDQPGFRDKWAALAASYQLHGYHYLAPPTLQKALERTIPYIPRYMLFASWSKPAPTTPATARSCTSRCATD